MRRSGALLFLWGHLTLISVFSQTGPYSSPRTSLLPAPVGAGGAILQSSNGLVQLHSVIGDHGGFSSAIPAITTLKSGYVSQLYEVESLSLESLPATVDETMTRQLAVTGVVLHDGSLLHLQPDAIQWSVLNGPITMVGPSGLATAGIVYENTAATVGGRYLGIQATVGLSVLDAFPDNFGSYAGDGLTDSWQAGFFGLDNPNAAPGQDPDGDGDDNRFEKTAGLDPTDPNSFFRLSIDRNVIQPGDVDIRFSPRFEDRIYRVLFAPMLGSAFQELTGGVINDEGEERTVTDGETSSPVKFYQVEITQP